MAGLLVVTMLLAVIAVNGEVQRGSLISEERRLYDYLMNGYHKSVRPVQNSSNAINVNLGLTLLSIEDLNEVQQVLTSHVWFYLSWRDEQLQWNRTEFDVGSIRIETEKLWTPDITLYNAHHDRYQYSLNSLGVVQSSGNIDWVPTMRLQSQCSISIRKFPFDEQTCVLKFGSWTYAGDLVNLVLQSDKIDTTSYIKNAEWDVTKTTAVRNTVKYDCCKETYIDITFSLSLRRRSDYLAHLLLAPSVVMTLLIPFIFLLPSDSGEKIMLGVGLLVGLILMLVSFIPLSHGEVPLIGIYYLTSIVLVSLSLVFSTLILNSWNRSFRNKRMAPIVRKIMLGVFGRVLCVQRDNFVPSTDIPTMNMQKLEVMHNAPEAFAEERPDDRSEDRINMMSTVTRLTVISEWRQLAVVLDRMFFIIFLIVTVIVSIALAH